jgi:hypothetical protein
MISAVTSMPGVFLTVIITVELAAALTGNLTWAWVASGLVALPFLLLLTFVVDRTMPGIYSRSKRADLTPSRDRNEREPRT